MAGLVKLALDRYVYIVDQISGKPAPVPRPPSPLCFQIPGRPTGPWCRARSPPSWWCSSTCTRWSSWGPGWWRTGSPSSWRRCSWCTTGSRCCSASSCCTRWAAAEAEAEAEFASCGRCRWKRTFSSRTRLRGQVRGFRRLKCWMEVWVLRWKAVEMKGEMFSGKISRNFKERRKGLRLKNVD